MSNSIRFLVLTSFLTLTIAAFAESERKTTPGNGPNGVPQVVFTSHRLGTDHAEGITTLDMNGDGYPDILSGSYWYENPGAQGGTWKQHQYRTVAMQGEFVSDCGEWIVDVNHDGAPDVVTTGWMSKSLWWYENPKKPDTMWERHFIAETIDTEGGWMADINGDGKPDLILAHYNRGGIIWVDFASTQPKVHHVMGKEQDGHGTGIADINGDSKPDILTPTGWLENVDADHDQWKWHPDWDLGETGFPIIGYDVNNDGKMDIIYGRGHSYGIYWLEQQQGGTWVQHIVDESFSQVHALKVVDIDGDGEPELIAGKRYRGHDGHDPGSYDPLVIYYYKINRKTGQFTRYAISVNGTAGAGTQFVTEDLDKDGDIDIAVAGKTGVHFLENLKVDKVPADQREREILINKDWPFPNEGQTVQQENAPQQ